MDGWIDDLKFYIFSTVFQSYQDNGQMIMKGSVQWNPVYNEISPQAITQGGKQEVPKSCLSL